MAKDTDDLLAEIDRFLEETGMGPAAFGKKSVNNGHLVARLRCGRDIGMATGERLRAFMAEYRAREVARLLKIYPERLSVRKVAE